MYSCLEIIKDYIENSEYDGLSTDDCGCGVDDFAPGEDCPHWNCEVAYKYTCTICSIDWYGPERVAICPECEEEDA